MLGRRLLLAAAFVASGCDEGLPATPAGLPLTQPASSAPPPPITDAGVSPDADAGRPPVYRVCPDGGLDASFASIFTGMLTDPGCGSALSSCHSTTGAMLTGNQLDLSLDASAVYAELLGPDGGGQLAANVAADAGELVLRVAPGDAGASLLYIKLTLMGFDPRYGWGMPYDQPGSVCPPAVSAVKAWIDDGAKSN